MAEKYKIKITKAYHIAIEDKDGYEVDSDWSFFDYKETKKQAEKMLAEVERSMSADKVGGTKPKHKMESLDFMEDGSYKLTFDDGEVWYHKIVGKRKKTLFIRKEGQEWKEVR